MAEQVSDEDESTQWLDGPYAGQTVAESKRRPTSFKLWHGEQPSADPKPEVLGEPAVEEIEDPRVVIRARYLKYVASEAKYRAEAYQLQQKHPWLIASPRAPRTPWVLYAVVGMFALIIGAQLMSAYYAGRAAARNTALASPAPSSPTPPTTSPPAPDRPEPAGEGARTYYILGKALR